jgi:hypothetical protein
MAKDAQVGHRLYAIWKKHYASKHDHPYIGSKYRDASMLKGVAEDIGEQKLRDIMEFYFEHKRHHDFTSFIFNYDALLKEKEAVEKDERYRLALRERTRRVMQELSERDED